MSARSLIATPLADLTEKDVLDPGRMFNSVAAGGRADESPTGGPVSGRSRAMAQAPADYLRAKTKRAA
jgi:hypothetical protein